MKKLNAIIPMILALLSLSACSGNQQTSPAQATSSTTQNESAVSSAAENADQTTQQTAGTADSPETVTAEDSIEAHAPKILVAYFSTPEITDATTTPSRVTVNGEIYGTTEYMATVIHQNIDSDLFRIEVEEPYGSNVPDRAKSEQEQGILPALSTHIDNPEQYDIIFVGYPTWWYDMPQVMYSFFNEYDFSGKTIIPFNSHGGSQFSGSVEKIAKLQPNANVSKNGLTLPRGNVDSSESTIIQWLDQLDISGR